MEAIQQTDGTVELAQACFTSRNGLVGRWLDVRLTSGTGAGVQPWHCLIPDTHLNQVSWNWGQRIDRHDDTSWCL